MFITSKNNVLINLDYVVHIAVGEVHDPAYLAHSDNKPFYVYASIQNQQFQSTIKEFQTKEEANNFIDLLKTYLNHMNKIILC